MGDINHEAAFKWAAALPPGSDAVERIVESWADQDPAAAGQYALQMSPETVRQQVMIGVIRRWVTQNPVEAAQWLMQNADAQTLNLAMIQLMNTWAPESPQEAEHYVEDLPNGPSRDMVVHDFVQAVTNWDPDLGAKEAMTLTDQGLRGQDVVSCVQHWLQMAPSSANQWLKEANLPQYMKDRCLLPLATGQPMR